MFDPNRLKVKNRIGQGSFGEVYTAEHVDPRQPFSETVVIKKAIRALDAEERRLFLKEVALLKGLDHANVVHMKGVCYKPCALMLEYLYFSFIPFGENKRVSSLDDLLLHIDAEYSFEGFEDLVMFAARDIVRGLAYLHANGVAHRDLKPANVLVSNQHYSTLSGEDQIGVHFTTRPIVCKLTDFGESRSHSVQTNTVLATKTKRVDRGTAVYMSPEILVQDNSTFEASLHNLMASDIWALGMTFFTMINPSLKCPCLLEIRSSKETIATQGDVQKFVSNLLRNKKLPKSDGKYNKSRATARSYLEEVYLGCTNFDPSKRFTLCDIDEVLDGKYDVYKTCDVVKLSVTQSTAIEQADREIANRIQNQDQSPGPVQ